MEFKLVFSKSGKDKFNYNMPNGFALINNIEKAFSVIVHDGNFKVLNTRRISKRHCSYNEDNNSIEVVINNNEAKELGIFANTDIINITITDDYIKKFVDIKYHDYRNIKNSPDSGVTYIGLPDFACEAVLNVNDMIEHWKSNGCPTSLID